MLFVMFQKCLELNVPMKYIGASCTYFGRHMVEEDLASISNVKRGRAKFWEFCPAANMQRFKNFCFEHIPNIDYLNKFCEDAKRSSLPGGTLFKPPTSQKYKLSLCVAHLCKDAGRFLFLPQNLVIAASILVLTSIWMSDWLTVPGSIPTV